MKTQASAQAQTANKETGQEVTQLQRLEMHGRIFQTVTIKSLQMLLRLPKSTITARMTSLLERGVFHELKKSGKFTTYQFVEDPEKRDHYAGEYARSIRAKRVNSFLNKYADKLTPSVINELENLAQ